MYPTDHCHICNSNLNLNKELGGHVCLKDEEHYSIWEDGVVSIKINEYLFEFYPKNHYGINKMRVWLNQGLQCIYEVDDHLYVDQNNYLKILDRLKILQAFK